MRLGRLDTAERVVVVAEIGNNHEGDIGRARELVVRAAAAGADAVKFQTFRTRLFASPSDAERYARLERFELTPEQFGELSALARAHGLAFLSTPLDLESVAVLEPIVDALKVASGDNTFVPLLDAVAATGKPLVVSAGLVDLDGITATVARLERAWADRSPRPELAVLQCVSSYPAPVEEASLAAIPVLAARLGCTIGYSDHTLGIEIGPLAVAAGARILEKHFTLDKALSDFRDHQLSADPDELAELVRRVRVAEAAAGPAEKTVQPSEAPLLEGARRSVVAGRDLPAGHVLAWEDLLWQRPAGGLPPGDEERVLGGRTRRAIRFGERLSPDDVER